jgi:hypothetical protein
VTQSPAATVGGSRGPATPVDPAASVDRVVQVVLAMPGVAGLGGSAAEATYLPGRRVTGVRYTDDGIEVHVVMRWGPDLRAAAAAVRHAVEALGLGPVQVVVSDVDGPYERGIQT